MPNDRVWKMISPFWLVLLLSLVIYIYYKWGYAPYQVFKRRNIPGPPPLPFFGNILPAIFKKEKCDIIAEWCQKYGRVCGYFFGTAPFIATTDPAMLQQIFVTNFRELPEHGNMAILNSQATGLPPGIFECSFEEWKKVRHITLPAFTNAKLRMMSHHLEKSCSVLLDRMLEKSATRQGINVIKLYRDFVLEVSICAVLGQEVCLQKGEGSDFKSWVELGSSISHGKILPFLLCGPIEFFVAYQFSWLLKFYYWLSPGRYLPAFRNLKAVLNDCLRDRKQKAKANQLQENSVLDLLVAACEENGDQSLSDDEILSHCINFLFAAYDTTSLTLACASHLLATNTHVQDKLCGLLDDYWSQHQDASISTVAQNVSYLDMVVDETLRLYSPSPRIGRICKTDMEVCGIRVSKGMNIIVPVHYIHRMESIWGDPDVFRPERFEKEESAGRPPFSFMPMGVGPRNCVGLKLARVLIKVALVSLLQRHCFKCTHQTVETLQTECFTFTLGLKSSVFVDLQPRK